MEIPKNLKTNAEVGLYIAVIYNGISSRNDLMKMFRYKHKRSLERILKHMGLDVIEDTNERRWKL